jgi:L-threonylcarbamoyladenylate synthase
VRMVASGDGVALATTIDALRANGAQIGVVVYSDFDLPFREDVIVRVLPARAEPYASVLFAALHELDSAGVTGIVIEAVPDLPSWDAVRDRLTRAAS